MTIIIKVRKSVIGTVDLIRYVAAANLPSLHISHHRIVDRIFHEYAELLRGSVHFRVVQVQLGETTNPRELIFAWIRVILRSFSRLKAR